MCAVSVVETSVTGGYDAERDPKNRKIPQFVA